MRYQVIKRESHIGRKLPFFMVVDTVAGHDANFVPNSIIASCKLEADADNIAKQYNAAAEIDPATGVPRALINRLPSYDDLQDENKTLREENAAMSVQHDAYQRQLANLNARVADAEKTGRDSGIVFARSLIEAVRLHLPELHSVFTILDFDRAMGSLETRLADAMASCSEWERRAREAETRMTMFDEDTRTKILQNSIRNAEGRASNAWRRTAELEDDVKKLCEQTRELHQHIIDAAPNRTIGDPLPEYIKRLEVRSAELTTCEDLNQKQNAAIGDLRIERDEWKDKAEEFRQAHNSLLQEAKYIVEWVKRWMR